MKIHAMCRTEGCVSENELIKIITDIEPSEMENFIQYWEVGLEMEEDNCPDCGQLLTLDKTTIELGD